MQITNIPAALIRAGNNDRKHFNQQALQELAASIASDGLLQTPTVRPMPDGSYQIVAGERRTRAMRDVLQWTTIPVIIRELSDEEAAALMLLENTARADLNPVDESDAYQSRISQFQWSIAKIARTAGVSRSRVTERLRLQALTPYIKDLVRRNIIPANYAQRLDVLDANRQQIAIHTYRDNPTIKIPVWQALIQRLLDEQGAEKQSDFLELAMQSDEFVKQESSRKRKGDGARTGVKGNPIAGRIPDGATPAEQFDRYIRQLRSDGNNVAAAALGNMYNRLVADGAIELDGDLQLNDPDAGDVTQELARASATPRPASRNIDIATAIADAHLPDAWYPNTTAVAEIAGIPGFDNLNRRDQNAISAALKARGFTRKQRRISKDANPRKVWINPLA